MKYNATYQARPLTNNTVITFKEAYNTVSLHSLSVSCQETPTSDCSKTNNFHQQHGLNTSDDQLQNIETLMLEI